MGYHEAGGLAFLILYPLTHLNIVRDGYHSRIGVCVCFVSTAAFPTLPKASKQKKKNAAFLDLEHDFLSSKVPWCQKILSPRDGSILCSRLEPSGPLLGLRCAKTREQPEARVPVEGLRRGTPRESPGFSLEFLERCALSSPQITLGTRVTFVGRSTNTTVASKSTETCMRWMVSVNVWRRGTVVQGC